MKRRLFSRLLAVLLMLGLLAVVTGGCEPNATTTATTTQATTKATTTATTKGSETTSSETEPADPFYIEGAEDITFTYWCTMQDYASQYYTTMAEHPYYQWLEEKTGIKIEFIHPTWEQVDQQLTLMISSREFYDFLQDAWYPGGPQAGIDEECFVDLLPYLDAYMPNYKVALYDEGNEFNSWEWSEAEKKIFKPQPQKPAFASVMFTFDGQLWAMSDTWRDDIPAGCGPVIRKDWLDDAGLAIPRTIDELETALAAFKERGAIGMALPAAGYVSIWEGAMLISAYVTGGYFELAEDGITILDHTYIRDEFKEYLMKIRDWYAAGYIDPDFMNSDGDTVWAKMVDDNLGVWLNYWGNPQYIMDAYAGEEEFEIAPMPLPRKTADQKLRMRQGYVTEPTSWLSISSSCKYPEIAAQWMDKHYTKEAALRQNYGIEGETYEMVDGVPLFLDSYFTDEDELPEIKSQIILKAAGPNYWSTRASILLSQNGDNTKAGLAVEASLLWSENAEIGLRIPYTVFKDDDWGAQENLTIEVATYADPMILRFITGEENIEEKWDAYVQTCLDLGIREARDIWQESYSTMLEIAAGRN